MKAETLNEIIDKCKTKKDGIHSHKGHKYAYKKGTHLFVVDGHAVYQAYGGFLTKISKDFPYKWDAWHAMRLLHKGKTE